MNYFYNIYASVDSIACKKAVEFLHSKKVPFILTIIDGNHQFEQNLKASTGRENLPIIFKQLNEQLILIGNEKDLVNVITTEENNGNG